jgi:hypothetical protein
MIQLHKIKLANTKQRYDVGLRVLVDIADVECIEEREHGSMVHFKSGRTLQVYETYDFIMSKKLNIGE